jgi:hypothetical protein
LGFEDLQFLQFFDDKFFFVARHGFCGASFVPTDNKTDVASLLEPFSNACFAMRRL